MSERVKLYRKGKTIYLKFALEIEEVELIFPNYPLVQDLFEKMEFTLAFVCKSEEIAKTIMRDKESVIKGFKQGLFNFIIKGGRNASDN